MRFCWMPRRRPKRRNACWRPCRSRTRGAFLFVQGGKMTPLVEVAATGTRVWESSCGSGTVALAWYLAQNLADGMHAFAFDEPGGRLEARAAMRAGSAAQIEMGGAVKLGEEAEIEL